MGWRRYVAPAAFLLAATVAVLLIRAGIDRGGSKPAATPTTTVRSRPAATTATTSARKRPHARRRYWTVRAGDTFAVVSTRTGVPVATIERLNPTVKSTSLFIGEKLRIG